MFPHEYFRGDEINLGAIIRVTFWCAMDQIDQIHMYFNTQEPAFPR